MSVPDYATKALCRSIVGIENRTAQEVHDIMCDRIRFFLSTLPIAGEGKALDEEQIAKLIWQHLPSKVAEEMTRDKHPPLFPQAEYTVATLSAKNFVEAIIDLVTPSSPGKDGGQEVEAARDVLAERDRQKAVEGWTPEHDDAHTDFSLAKAACIYGVGATLNGPDRAVMDEFGASGTPGWMKELWPWDIKWWKPKDRRRDLVKAAALIIAEIERLDRSALSASQSTSREGER